MKKSLRLTAALVAFCVALTVLPPVGFAAGGKVLTLPDETDLRLFIQSSEVSDGDIISLGNSSTNINDPGSNDAPWIIRKSVTIQDGQISLRAGGIILGADVTFKNIDSFSFDGNMRNAIVANGHTLTLDNVQCAQNINSINLFCGGYVGSETFSDPVPSPGGAGTIIIRGKTNLQNSKNLSKPGNIYAGNLSVGGPANTFQGDAVISIEDSAGTGALGTVYACGAHQIDSGSSGKVVVPDPSNYTVSGTVSISGKIPDVNGTGAARTDLTYAGGQNASSSKFENISSLAVSSGDISLKEGSSLQDAAPLSVSSGAKLNITALGDLTIGDFGGGGALVLGKSQLLTITGAVTGQTTLHIDGFSGNTASEPLENGRVYIDAPSSGSDAFQLQPNSSHTNITLVWDGSRNWAVSAEESPSLVSRFCFKDKTASIEDTSGKFPSVELELTAENSNGDILYLDYLPLDIYVYVNGNRNQAVIGEDFWGDEAYLTDDLSMIVASNALSIELKNKTPGRYVIEIVIPGEHTADGQPLRDSATLTVGSPGPVSIPVPKANAGLKWTGQLQTGVDEGTGYTLTGHTATDVGEYIATAALESGYQWEDGSTAPKEIPWSIGKASGPAAPAGLSGAAPTSEGGSDGRITGTTSAMEYSQKADFADSQTCGEAETAGLSPGTYYVRLKETRTHEAGSAAVITVPAYGAPTVASIAVASTGHKTEYAVGDTLDVSNLVIEVTFSDGSAKRVSVTADMVSGFDASQAAESQTLTISYEGKTAEYTVRIKAADPPVTGQYQVTVTNSHAEVTGEGRYDAGDLVTVHAGSRSGYRFAAWEATGVTLADSGSPDTSFEMPENDVSLLIIWRPVQHTHSWSSAWVSNAAYHWHNCAAGDCPITADSQKSGYAAHTAGDWVVDQAATAAQSGSRHRACSVCGYVMERQTLPATGGGSSSGGGSSGGSSSGSRPSSGSGSTSTATNKNPDGSTTTTSTNQTTGTVIETTKRPDGSQTVIETRKDGTVTSTEKAADGSTVKTVEKPDGSSTTTVKRADGAAAEISTDQNGRTEAQVTLPSKVVSAALNSGGIVTLPVPELPVTRDGASVLTVRTGSFRPLRVEIPAVNPTSGTVAVLVGPDGAATVVKSSLLTENGIAVTVSDGASVKLVDNSKHFSDTRGHWAESAINFVSARELFTGRTATAFAPDAPMSRAMLMTVLARLDGADTTGSAYEKGMAWAVAHGVSDGTNPDSQITRQQLVVMLHRYAGSPAVTNQELRFSDAGAVSGHALEAVCWAVENGILSGYSDGSLMPGGKASRAQVAAMLMRYMKLLNQSPAAGQK